MDFRDKNKSTTESYSSNMSFLKDIKGFSKKQLNTVATEISTVDGRRLKETRDDYGRSHLECIDDGGLGFVGDLKPDLQVGEIMEGMILGEFGEIGLAAWTSSFDDCLIFGEICSKKWNTAFWVQNTK